MRDTQDSRIRRARGPLSPPAITQWMPVRSTEPRSSSSGSADTKRTTAGVACSARNRGSPCRLFSTLTPNQTCGRSPIHRNSPSSRRRMRSWRLVSTWNVCRSAFRMTLPTSAMYAAGTDSWNKSLMELTKIRRGRRHDSGWSSFSGTRRRSKPCSNGCPATPRKRSANVCA